MTNHLRFPSIPVTELSREAKQWRDRFESVLEQRLPPESQDPVLLHRAMRYASLVGGKRFRPIMVYSTGKALGLSADTLDPVAAAIEKGLDVEAAIASEPTQTLDAKWGAGFVEPADFVRIVYGSLASR